MIKKIQYIGTLGLFIFSTLGYAQIKEEKLILNRKRVPEVKKIEKKKSSVAVIKDYPKEEKSKNLVRYQITDIPVASDFQTSTINGEDVSPVMKNDYKNNYLRFGMGNYGKILGDGFASYAIDAKNEIGVDAHYLSTSGLKKDYAWDSNQMRTKVGAFINHYANKGKWNLTGKFNTDKHQYYGIYALQPNDNVDIQQNTNSFGISGSYDHYSNEILDKVQMNASFLNDHFKAKETALNFGVLLAKNNLNMPIEDLTLDGKLGLNFENINTDFDIQNKNNNSYLMLNASPEIKVKKNDFYLKIGSDFSFLNHQFDNDDLTEKETNNTFYWFPKAELQWAKSSAAKFFVGVDGGLNLNTYQQFLNENPYTLSNQMLKPTNTKYHIYGGLRGDWEQTVKYEISANYSKIDDIQFFSGNSVFNHVASLDRTAYDYANTFSAVYDDGTLLQLKAEINYFPLENLVLEGDFSFNQYQLDHYADILNIPFVEAGLGAKYRLLNNRLLLGTKVFLASNRTTNSFTLTEQYNPTTNLVEYTSTENDTTDLKGYVDFNLSAEYHIYKNFSIFAVGNNLTNQKYQTYKGYKTLGAQILGGLKVRF